jgi:hypothetical protein
MKLDRAFDSPEAKRRYNARLFTTIADRYDFITRLLSYGRDQAWKRDLIARAGIRPGRGRAARSWSGSTWRRACCGSRAPSRTQTPCASSSAT